MKIRFVAGIAALLWTAASFAAPPTREAVDTLLTVTKTQRVLDSMLANMDRSMTMGMRSALGSQQLTPEQQQSLDSARTKMNAIFRDEMRWDRLEPIYVQVYQQTFTQEEVDGLIAFYRTPSGQALVDKMPLALQNTIEAMQPILADVMRRSQAVARETIDETRGTPK